jgi:hypothetical protein
MVAAMESVIRERTEKAEQVDSLRVDQETAEPALPKLAAAWARLQDHVSTSFQSGVSACGSAVSNKTFVVVDKIDRSAIMCSHAANDGTQYVASSADETAAKISAAHNGVVRQVDETSEAAMAKMALARAETMRKVEDTQATFADKYDRARTKYEEQTAMCLPLPVDEAKTAVELDADQVEQLREAFSVFDKNGNGKVSTAELSMVMEECGEALTEAEIREMVKEVSVDGEIDFEEFKAIMTRLAAEEAGLPLSKRIAKVPLKMKAQWKTGVRHAHGTVERAKADAARAAAVKAREAEESVNSAVNSTVETTKKAAADAKQSTVGWLDATLASVLESLVPPPKKEPAAPVSLGSVGDMDDTQNAYVW